MKKIVIILLPLLIIMACKNLYADNTNTTVGASAGEFVKVGACGSQFLKIGVGARASGMAGAYGSVANDLTSIFWNPAGLADVKTISANISYTSWFAGFSHNFAAVSMPLGEHFTTALSVVSFSSDNIEITTDEVSEGTQTYYTVNDLSITASISGYLTDQFSFGFNGKMIRNAFSSEYATGFACDIGTLYNTGIYGIKLGFSIHNLGSQLTYSGQDLNYTMRQIESNYSSLKDVSMTASSYSLPLIFRASMSSEVYKEEDHSLLVCGDFVTYSDVPNQYILGAEYKWKNLISVRAGYVFNQDQFNFSGGVGFNYIGSGFIGQLDYSMSPMLDFGLVHRLTVNFSMK
jgi:hypothetical protein